MNLFKFGKLSFRVWSKKFGQNCKLSLGANLHQFTFKSLVKFSVKYLNAWDDGFVHVPMHAFLDR
jgi:hypothetical protein